MHAEHNPSISSSQPRGLRRFSKPQRDLLNKHNSRAEAIGEPHAPPITNVVWCTRGKQLGSPGLANEDLWRAVILSSLRRGVLMSGTDIDLMAESKLRSWTSRELHGRTSAHRPIWFDPKVRECAPEKRLSGAYIDALWDIVDAHRHGAFVRMTYDEIALHYRVSRATAARYVASWIELGLVDVARTWRKDEGLSSSNRVYGRKAARCFDTNLYRPGPTLLAMGGLAVLDGMPEAKLHSGAKAEWVARAAGRKLRSEIRVDLQARRDDMWNRRSDRTPDPILLSSLNLRQPRPTYVGDIASPPDGGEATQTGLRPVEELATLEPMPTASPAAQRESNSSKNRDDLRTGESSEGQARATGDSIGPLSPRGERQGCSESAASPTWGGLSSETRGDIAALMARLAKGSIHGLIFLLLVACSGACRPAEAVIDDKSTTHRYIFFGPEQGPGGAVAATRSRKHGGNKTTGGAHRSSGRHDSSGARRDWHDHSISGCEWQRKAHAQECADASAAESHDVVTAGGRKTLRCRISDLEEHQDGGLGLSGAISNVGALDMLDQEEQVNEAMEPTEGTITVKDRKKGTLVATCEAQGDAIWARWTFLYPVVVTSRKFVAHKGGETQDVSIETVIPPFGDEPERDPEYGEDVPRYLRTGELNILAQSPGADSIEIELTCRIDHAPEQVEASKRVEATRQALFDRMGNQKKQRAVQKTEPRSADRPFSDAPSVPGHIAPPVMRVPPGGLPEGVDMPKSDLPPEMVKNIDQQFAEMQKAGLDAYGKTTGKPPGEGEAT